MKLLSLDTSTKQFSLAITDKEKTLASREVILTEVLSQSIIPAIISILKKCKLTVKDLDGFVVGLGPGSFTSLRVGLATLKGLSFVEGKPIVGIPSLDAIAMAVPQETIKIVVIQDARRSLVYAAFYEKNKGSLKTLGDYQLISFDDLIAAIPFKGELFFTGDAVSLYKEKIISWAKQNEQNVTIDENSAMPKAKDLAMLAQEQFKSKKFEDVSKIVPLYLYPADCQVTR